MRFEILHIIYMYIYIYIYIYICVCVYIYMYVCMYVYLRRRLRYYADVYSHSLGRSPPVVVIIVFPISRGDFLRFLDFRDFRGFQILNP